MVFHPYQFIERRKTVDTKDPRLCDQLVGFEKASHTIVGYPDHEGIENNNGRSGAAEGPDRIRMHLYRMTPPMSGLTNSAFFDVGNLDTSTELKDRHEQAKNNVKELLSNNKKVLAFGGGHDYGYSDGAGFLEEYKDKTPLIINFDAHLDVRTFTDKITSGTPFRRLINEYPKKFELVQIGAQEQCNSREHFEWCKEKDITILTFDEISQSHLPVHQVILETLSTAILKKRPAYLSVDMDVFSQSVAPGCSQSWPTGLSVNDFFKVYEVLLKRLDVKVLGIYETAPRLDLEDQTSRLAALIGHKYLFQS